MWCLASSSSKELRDIGWGIGEFEHASYKFQSSPIPRRIRLVIASRMVTI
ncbi:hypothetical protein M407DRAFT_244656 [Tulasnella calospora MUT 4182]|uniref:Uncharacterized protein n=1 Tax=Tulasnella calospora MUT 4182 TaxID=1051891 RepID=A0A0C3Q4J0_9AGAM|nr:hypothetical protein M407DRAFT_244656 [Tulasnella calospora MUT 4182]